MNHEFDHETTNARYAKFIYEGIDVQLAHDTQVIDLESLPIIQDSKTVNGSTSSSCDISSHSSQINNSLPGDSNSSSIGVSNSSSSSISLVSSSISLVSSSVDLGKVDSFS